MDPRQIRNIIYAPIGSGSRSGSVIAVAHVTPSRTMLPFLSISRNCYNNKKERAREPWRGVLRSHHLHALIKELPHLRARKFVIHDSRSSCATKYLYSRLRSHCERKLNFPWTTMILNRRGGGEWSGEGRGNFVEESRMVAKRRINSSKWLFNEPKCLTQIPSRITRRDPVDDAVSRQRFPKRTVTPWLTRLVKASRCSTNTWTGSRSVFPFFFFFNRCTNWNSLQGETIQSRKYRWKPYDALTRFARRFGRKLLVSKKEYTYFSEYTEWRSIVTKIPYSLLRSRKRYLTKLRGRKLNSKK